MTERLYYRDAFLAEFTATVTELGDGGRRVYLDRTALYPTSGGQQHDTGTLGAARVIDVVDEGDRIAHVVDEPLPAGTRLVTATVDWPRRFDHMQQHTGQHLLSAVLADAGRETVSVHFGDTTSTLDVTGEEPLDIPAAERRANTLIAENRVIGVTFEDALAAQGLRKRADRTGMIRIVTIEGVDRSACGGTHVARTGEIGVVLVRRAERTRGRTRVEFVCGLRAVARARADLAALSTIAAGFSTGLDEAPAVVAEARAELASLRREAEQLAGALAKRDAHERYAAVQPDGRGRRLIVERRRDGGVDALRQLGLAVAALDGAVFLGASEDPPAVLLASSPSSGLDAGATLKGALSALGGRGGGSPRLAQGSLPSADLVPSIIDIIAKAP